MDTYLHIYGDIYNIYGYKYMYTELVGYKYTAIHKIKRF